MHIILIAIIAALLIYIIINSQKTVSQNIKEPDAFVIADQSGDNGKQFLFISRGKLFMKKTSGQIEEIHSPYVQEMIDRMNRRKQMHGWKQNTSLSRSFIGQDNDVAGDQVELQVVSAQFGGNNKLIYFMKDSHVGGLFEYDAATKNEKRLLHKQNLFIENLSIKPEDGKILCSELHNNGVANIIMIASDGNDYCQLTEGDTVDSAPAWIPGDEQKVLYQSAGLARSGEGYVVAHGPCSIKMLDLENHNVISVLEDSSTDYLNPKVDRNGNLYFIRRPYEMHHYNGSNLILDVLLFPFRLLRAVFHYLNFFSLMYSSKPLTSASGPKVEADLKDILIKGKRIDAEKALRKENRIGGIPSLVPRTWQLIKRTQSGSETILATNVAAYDLTSDGSIMYSNGYAVFHLADESQPQVILRDKLIADIIAS